MNEINTEVLSRLPVSYRLVLKVSKRVRKQAEVLCDLAVTNFPEALPDATTAGVAEVEQGILRYCQPEIIKLQDEVQEAYAEFKGVYGSIWISLLVAVIIELIKWYFRNSENKDVLRDYQSVLRLAALRKAGM